MKSNKIFRSFKFILLVVMLFGCSNSEDSPETPEQEVTSIVLSASINSLLEGQSVSFSAINNLNQNVTSQIVLTINGSIIANPYTFNEEGNFDVVASLNSLTSNVISITVEAPPQASSITLSANELTIDEGHSVTFSVIDDLQNIVTTLSEIKVNGTTINSNPYTFATAGDYTVEATYQDLTSNQVQITVVGPSPFADTSSFSASGSPSSFTKKALLEDFTGTWCPNCPPAAAAVANAISGNSNIFGVGYHYGVSSYPDPMEISETNYWTNYYNVTGFPTVYVNGPDTRWDFPDAAQINAELAEDAGLGLAVSAEIIGGKLDLEVQVGYKSAIFEEIKLMIYLIEDNVTTNSSQAGSSQGSSYVHRDVLREVYTDQLGDVISTSNIGVGGIYTRTITGLSLPNTIFNPAAADLKLIAYVRNTYTKTFTDYFGDVWTDSPHYDIYNVQEVHVGSDQAFN